MTHQFYQIQVSEDKKTAVFFFSDLVNEIRKPTVKLLNSRWETNQLHDNNSVPAMCLDDSENFIFCLTRTTNGKNNIYQTRGISFILRSIVAMLSNSRNKKRDIEIFVVLEQAHFFQMFKLQGIQHFIVMTDSLNRLIELHPKFQWIEGLEI